MNILFVAFSHTLSDLQKNDFVAKYGDTHFVLLSDAAPELHENLKNVDPSADASGIRELAKAIVTVAAQKGATHFYFAGEPSLAFWAQLYAGTDHWGNPVFGALTMDAYAGVSNMLLEKRMTVVTSTTHKVSVEKTEPDGSVTKTSVFAHKQWRELY